MKLSVTIATEGAKENAFVVWRGVEQSMRKAAEYGYDGVELGLKTASEVEPAKLRGWLKEFGLEISCITTGQVFGDSGLYFTHPDPAIRRKARDVFIDMIHLASEFSGMVNIGRARGFLAEGRTKEQTAEMFLGALRELTEEAVKCGVTIIVEPVNRYEINFINSLDDGARLLEGAGLPNVGLMPDVFHMNIEDDRIGDSLIRNGKWVKYIHLADSNRWAPGMGHLDFDEVFAALKAIGFNGWASAEILPFPEPDIAARDAAAFLKPKIQAYNASI